MSEKLFDLSKLNSLISKDADPVARRLLEARMEQEALDDAAEAASKPLTVGAPPIPDAQLVYSQASGRMGVAVRGARRVCELPKGYAGPALELAVIEGERLIVIHPNHPPLLIDPTSGTTRRL